MVDAYAIGVGTVSVQADEKDQMQVVSYSSRIFTECEQKKHQKSKINCNRLAFRDL